MDGVIKVLDLCMCCDVTTDLYTRGCPLQNHLHDPLPLLCTQFPGKQSLVF